MDETVSLEVAIELVLRNGARLRRLQGCARWLLMHRKKHVETGGRKSSNKLWNLCGRRYGRAQAHRQPAVNSA